MPQIQLFDVFPYLHTAKHVVGFGNKSKSYFPVGGMDFFLRKLTAELGMTRDMALAFDARGSAQSKTKIKSYKGNRTRHADVVAQAEYLYDKLSRCGVACYKGEGEADDYIFNICNEYVGEASEYTPIIINSTDYDLCHNLDDRGAVKFYSVNSLANNVSVANYESVLRCGRTDERVIFNTISAAKVFCGDSSDSIKPFTAEDGTKGIVLYKDFIDSVISQVLNKPGYVKRDPRLLQAYIDARITSQSDKRELKARMDTIYPKIITRADGFPLSNNKNVNLQGIMDLCCVIGCSDGIRNLGKLGVRPRPDGELQAMKDELYELGKNFNNGVYQADNNLNVKSLNIFSEAINVGDF